MNTSPVTPFDLRPGDIDANTPVAWLLNLKSFHTSLRDTSQTMLIAVEEELAQRNLPEPQPVSNPQARFSVMEFDEGGANHKPSRTFDRYQDAQYHFKALLEQTDPETFEIDLYDSQNQAITDSWERLGDDTGIIEITHDNTYPNHIAA